MQTPSFLLTATLSATIAAAVGLAGCNHDQARSDVPDRSDGTKAQAEAIRDDSQRRNAAIDADVDQRTTALGFRTTQVEKKAAQEREQIAIDLSEKIQPLKAKQDEARATSEREIVRIDSEAKAKLATVSGDEAARVTADADSRKAESHRAAAVAVADHEAKIAELKAKSAKRVDAVDAGEAVEKAAIAKDRAELARQARERKLAVSVETTAKLDELGKQSAERQAAASKQEAANEKSDQRITADVRKGLDRHGEPARGVTISTHDGVVVLGGGVADAGVKKAVLAEAGTINGVVRVEDRIAVH